MDRNNDSDCFSIWNIVVFVAGRVRPNPSAQIPTENQREEASPIHSLGSSQHPGGIITQVPLRTFNSQGVWSHAGQPHKHLLCKYRIYTYPSLRIYVLRNHLFSWWFNKSVDYFQNWCLSLLSQNITKPIVRWNIYKKGIIFMYKFRNQFNIFRIDQWRGRSLWGLVIHILYGYYIK